MLLLLLLRATKAGRMLQGVVLEMPVKFRRRSGVRVMDPVGRHVLRMMPRVVVIFLQNSRGLLLIVVLLLLMVVAVVALRRIVRLGVHPRR